MKWSARKFEKIELEKFIILKMMEKVCLVQWGGGEKGLGQSDIPRWDWIYVPSLFPMLSEKLGP